MKKYFLMPLLATCCCALSLAAADFGDLLDRLDSDYSKALTAETNVSWLGTTGNPNANLEVFKARDEFRVLMGEAFQNAEKTAALNAFIVDALGKNLQPSTKVWLLEQLAVLGTGKEVPAVAPLLGSDNRLIADAAAACLAKIPGPEAAEALKKGTAACKAALVERDRPLPAWRPVEGVMPFALANASDADVEKWLAGYDQLDVLVQAQTLAGLTARGDLKYRKYALDALKSDSEILRKAGFLALEKLATKDDADLFVAQLATDNRDTAIRLAGFVVADGFDAALKARLAAATEPQRVLDLVTILTTRATDVRAEVFAKTTAAECANRLALLQQVVKICTTADVPQLVASTLQFPASGERDAAENLIAALCNADATPIVALLGKYPIADIYSIIGRTGGDAAMAEVNKGLASTDAEVRAAAIRALTVWPNAKFADKMFSVATDKTYTPEQNVSALRAFIRVISLPDDKIGIGISKDGKLAKLQEAFQIATRVDEKKLILSRLAANRTAKSLAFAVECAQDPALANAAYYAIADHAHDNVLRQQNMDVFGPAMDLVINNSTDKNLVERVKRYKLQK
ncbi:MAG: hypothetical protein Q4D98_02125 [Planctomycetia bacterium]|nr:hypothetical protein [Planctomycetia bacterium]